MVLLKDKCVEYIGRDTRIHWYLMIAMMFFELFVTVSNETFDRFDDSRYAAIALSVGWASAQ